VRLFLQRPVRNVRFALGYQYGLALDEEGKLWAWGYNVGNAFGVKYNSNIGANSVYYYPQCVSDKNYSDNILYGKKSK
jgi:alpha-tubulin suppressor-like RCC1 family protein